MIEPGANNESLPWRLKDLDDCQSAFLSSHIACLFLRTGTAEPVKIQRAAGLKLEAFETVAGLQAGVHGLPDNIPVMPQIFNQNLAVRTPSEPDMGARLKYR